MTEHSIRFFPDDAAVRHIGEGLLACTLRREEWTHEAHLAACLWLVIERPEIDLDGELRNIISSFNELVGGVNDDRQGYHHTITMTYLAAVRGFAARAGKDLALVDRVNALLAAPEGRRDFPLTFYSPARLFSVEARLGYVFPDLAVAR